MTRAFLVLAWTAWAAGCSSSTQAYEGPARPDAHVATILPDNAWNRARASIAPAGHGEVRVRVNGQRLGFMERSFKVLPGRRSLEVVYRTEQTPWPTRILRTRSVILPLDAQAGRTYAIRGQPTYGREGVSVRLFALDAGTRRTVAQIAVPKERIVLEEVPEEIDEPDAARDR